MTPTTEIETAAAAQVGGLSADRKRALIGRARAILAGRLKPEPMVTPPEVERFLEVTLGGFDPPPTPEAVQYQRDSLNLQHYYPGTVIVRHTTPDGTFAVLAAGENEFKALLAELPDEDRSRVLVDFTDP